MNTNVIYLFICLSFFFVSSCANQSSKSFTQQKKTTKINTTDNVNLEELEQEILKLEERQKNLTKIEFNKTTHNFGNIKNGNIVSTQFTIKNIGHNPLKLIRVSGSCGCTVPTIDTNTVIKPNETREIHVDFDSTDRLGEQLKFVKVFGNFEPSPSLLKIDAIVLPND